MVFEQTMDTRANRPGSFISYPVDVLPGLSLQLLSL